MKILLDTCSFLWLVAENNEKLSDGAIDVFLNEKNEIYFSIVSAWEISIKSSIGKLELTLPVRDFLTEQIELNELSLLPIELNHVAKVAELPFHHKDPFDRLLIAQAIVEDILLLSPDSAFDCYDVKRIWD